MAGRIVEYGLLLDRLAPGHIIQPATALWRVYELDAVFRHVELEGRVLDLGCCDGSLSGVVLGLMPRVTSAVGVEPDAHDAEVARRSGVFETVHTARGDRIPEPDQSFDMVFSNSVLEHIDPIEPVLRECARLLRPGGAFVATVPSEQFHDCLVSISWYAALARRHGESEREATDRRLQHYRYWPPRVWEEALAAQGLILTEWFRYLPKGAMRAWQRWATATGGLAFELFGRRNTPREVQRKLGMPTLSVLLPHRAQTRMLRFMLRKPLSLGPDVGDEPSGGLLWVARKSGPGARQ